MYKLLNSYIDKMVSKKLSSKEIDFILHIAVYQNETGRVESVYYKDVCNAINISIQKFYDILKSLSEKDMITYEKIHNADVCVTLVGNDCSNNKFKAGYLKVADQDFKHQNFRKLKAGSKLLYLYTQRFKEGKHMLVQNFYDSFCELFGVARKSLQKYLRELKQHYLLFISKKRNKAYNYEMTMKPSKILDMSKKKIIPRENEYYIENIRKLLEKNFSRYIPEDNGSKILQDIANLADTQRAKKYDNFISLIVTATSNSIKQQKKEGNKTPMLNAALVNKCLSNVLEEYVIKKYGISYG